MSEDRQVGDADFTDITAGDQARARALRKSLQRLADSPTANDTLKEMAREVLSGRVGLRQAMRIGAYSEALGEQISRARQEYEQLSPEDLERQQEEARGYLAAQREEIEQERAERQRASSGERPPRHSGRDWKL